MKKSMIFVLVLAVICSVFSCTFAEESVSFEPNMTPADFNSLIFGYAFDWGTDYDTVLEFVSQLSGFEMDTESSYISLWSTDSYSAPEVYEFRFSNGKLISVTGDIYTMCMGSSAGPSLVSIADTLKSVYGLNDLDPYTQSLKLNAEESNASASFIVADDYTIYGLFNMLKSGNSLSYVEFILMDKHQSETKVSSADAGITRENASDNAAANEPADTADALVNIQPAEFNSTTFGNAFDWGASYDTVLDFVSQLSGFNQKTDSTFINIHTSDSSAENPEDYRFDFTDGKLTTVTARIYTMWMHESAVPRLENIASALKSAYGLNKFGPYTESDSMKAKAGEARASFIVADGYTIYGLFNMVKDGSYLSYVEFVLTDRNQSETGISSLDAGITREIAYENAAANEPSGVAVGGCSYGSRLALGDTAEIVNVNALRMYEKAGSRPIDGLNAFPGKTFTIIDGPVCLNGLVWWKINFLGYTGWVSETDANGMYYIEKR